MRITVPEMGDFKDVLVIEILISVGDIVKTDQAIAILESDKATIEVPSSDSGVVVSVDVNVGDKVSAGSPLLTLRCVKENADANGSPAPNLESSSAVAAAGVSPPNAPVSLGGNAVEQKISIYEKSDTGDWNSTDSSPGIAALQEATSSATNTARVFAGPAVRKIAREAGVDLRDVKGSGPRGRIVAADIYDNGRLPTSSNAAENALHPVTESAPTNEIGLPPTIAQIPRVDYGKFGPVEKVSLSRIRRAAGANLHRNWVTIPHVTNHDDADITDLEAFRTELNGDKANQGVKVSILPLVIKACVAALKSLPEFNSSLDGESLVLKRFFNIGVAVDTADGLLVPVVRDVDQKGVIQLAKEMSELATKARSGKLNPSEMQGGSFSISSLGGIGGSYFTPIINAPEVAILGLGKAQTRVVWVDGVVQPRLILPLSLSWDHRVIDGAAAARFNQVLTRALRDLKWVLL